MCIRDSITTQYDMNELEKLGLLKMDFLGLRNLTVIDKTIDLVNKRLGKKIDINNIPLDDPKVYELFSKGLTVGVFQFESSGMREYLKKLEPKAIEDLIAMTALYRPCLMKNINHYIDRAHGKEKVDNLRVVLWGGFFALVWLGVIQWNQDYQQPTAPDIRPTESRGVANEAENKRDETQGVLGLSDLSLIHI